MKWLQHAYAFSFLIKKKKDGLQPFHFDQGKWQVIKLIILGTYSSRPNRIHHLYQRQNIHSPHCHLCSRKVQCRHLRRRRNVGRIYLNCMDRHNRKSRPGGYYSPYWSQPRLLCAMYCHVYLLPCTALNLIFYLIIEINSISKSGVAFPSWEQYSQPWKQYWNNT